MHCRDSRSKVADTLEILCGGTCTGLPAPIERMMGMKEMRRKKPNSSAKSVAWHQAETA